MQIMIRNHTLLRLTGHTPTSPNAVVGLSVSNWMRVIWWQLTGKFKR